MRKIPCLWYNSRMKVWIFTTKKDLSLSRLREESERLKNETVVMYFESLIFKDNHVFYKSEKLTKLVQKKDKVLIRWPFDADDTDIEYNVFVHYLLMYFQKQILLDKKCLERFSPFYEDKFFQSVVFSKLKVPTPKTYYFSSLESFLSSDVGLPLVLKKRVSSRSKNNFLIHTKREVKEKLKNKHIKDYIFQDVIEIEKDMRVLFLKDALLGIVRRFTHVREGNRLAVRGREVVRKIPKEIEMYAQKIQKYLGADYVGFDVLLDKDGNYFFIEANLSPQFDKFEDATGVNAAKKVIQTLLGQ